MKMNMIIVTSLSAITLLISHIGLTADTTKSSTSKPATGEEINWQVISSGGTKGTSASFGLNGTVGQAAIGSGSSTNYGVSSGFWPGMGGCCDKRGDVDNTGSIDVGDLTYLVAYLFQGGPAPPCPEEGDVDGSGSIDVGDLTYLVAYLFQGGPAPPPC
ncbi:MAG: dockerin type I repeat-containing protein [bacterium]